jgi:outer membrane protein assembly factor BamB
MKTLICPVVAGIALSGMALAKDWPEFRGPTRDGHSDAKNVPLEWNTTNHVVWSVPVEGTGWSTPILWHHRIYLTTALPGGATGEYSLRALCFDSETGKTIWDKEVFKEDASWSPGIHSKNSHASSSPVVDGDRIYFHFGHLGTACFDLEGTKQWENRTLRYTPVHGNGGSPVVVGDILFFSCDGASDPFVAALDKKTGELKWKEARVTPASRKFSFSTPGLIQVNGKTQIISPGSGAVIAYDPANGQEIWRARYGQGYSVVPLPLFGHGMTYIGTGFDQAKVIAVKYDGTGDVTDTNVVWTVSKGAPHTPSMILDGDELYMVSDAGVASCVDAKTGAVAWSERLGGGYSSSPVLVENRLYFINEEGLATVLKTGRTFEVLAKNDLAERTLASPAVDDGTLFIRTGGHLWRIGNASVESGKQRADAGSSKP